ncbi:glycoside hydrolase family 1 protein [Lacticaseibacillus daqingensis]|uniref:glycoside hydrolase family 1 protein n=1 Tax=Lacticaseibacillus daqingensis TaxID=2486014 RepID=UPI000F7A099B|nr:glycoside hydrolase family 1 protein [Lacticaseibacillus daqingensis]
MTNFLTFPDQFLWGAAASAPQTEGAADVQGKAPTIFDTWYRNRPDDFYDQVGPDQASDVYAQYRQDIKLMAQTGLNSYRTSISWARLLPDGQHLNPHAVDFYNDLIDTMLAHGIEPIMNLFHYDMPQLMQDRGGFLAPDVLDDFVFYATTAFRLFGNRVKRWSTFNEPKAQPYGGYLSTGVPDGYPPFRHNAQEAAQVMYHIALLTARCVATFRSIIPDGQIGLIEDSVPQLPADQSPENVHAAHLTDALRNRVLLDPAVLGRFNPTVVAFVHDNGLTPTTRPEDLACIAQNTVDYVGLTYYRPDRIKAPTRALASAATPRDIDFSYISQVFQPNNVRMNTSRGWEIRPESVYEIGIEMRDQYHNIPWFLAENGMGIAGEADDIGPDGRIHDQYRIDFLQEHLSFLHDAIQAGSNCFGYHVWTFVDCWSWRNAYKNRYGLFGLNRADHFRRIPKDSGNWYRQVIDRNGIADARS